MIISIIGWLGNLGFILGALLLAKKKMWGWYLQIFGNVCYTIFAILLGLNGISLGILSIILICTNIYGIYEWRNPTWIKMKGK